MFQWGHGLSPVETSIEWLRFSPHSRFNGATGFHPWKQPSGEFFTRFSLLRRRYHMIRTLSDRAPDGEDAARPLKNASGP